MSFPSRVEGDCGDDRIAVDPVAPVAASPGRTPIVPPSNRPAASRLPSGLKATSVVKSVGPPSGFPIACSPFTFQTTAERRCELTRVRPSGLNVTSLTGLVPAVSGEPYGAPVFASHTNTGPVERSTPPAAVRPG